MRVWTGNINDTCSSVKLEVPFIEPGQQDVVETVTGVPGLYLRAS
jgi:hypothetical protein